MRTEFAASWQRGDGCELDRVFLDILIYCIETFFENKDQRRGHMAARYKDIALIERIVCVASG